LKLTVYSRRLLINGGTSIYLLKFPDKVIKRILEHVLAESHPIELSKYPSYQPNLGIIATCRKLQTLGREVFYGQNTFEVPSTSINGRAYYFGREFFHSAPSMPYVQHLMLHISRTTDLPGLLELLEDCESLKTLVLVIESVQRNYVKTFCSLEFRKPPMFESVKALPAEDLPAKEDRQRACKILEHIVFA
jgi:hypothetical protein